MKYRHKMKQQETAKVKNQKHRVAKNHKRYEKRFYSCYSLRKEKAWLVAKCVGGKTEFY